MVAIAVGIPVAGACGGLLLRSSRSGTRNWSSAPVWGYSVSHLAFPHLPSSFSTVRQGARACAADGEKEASSYFSGTAGVLNVHDSNFFTAPASSKGWDDSRLQALLRSLAVAADDRAEMHSSVAVQRDNWGKLLQVTITTSMISAGILSALNTRTDPTFSLALTASLLASGSFLFMCLESWFQPSQMAEEQRAATRFFRALVRDIEASLKPGGANHLKEEANLFYQAKLEKLQYLDRAFPLPLFHGTINKFPTEIRPSVLSAPVDISQPEVTLSTSKRSSNGWTPAIVEDLRKTSALLKKSDMPTYVKMERNAHMVNKFLAVFGPSLALISAVANLVSGGALVAAVCSVLAALIGSFAHDAQVGMIYELYREVGGHLGDIDNEIQRTLRLPVDQREDGELFHKKIALTLGYQDDEAIVKSDDQKSAGSLL